MKAIGREYPALICPSPDHNATPAARKSAEIYKPKAFDLASSRAAIRDMAGDLIERTFPAPSRHQTCLAAAKVLGVSPDKVLRMIEGGAVYPDTLALCLAAGLFYRKSGQHHPIAIHLMKLLGAA